MGKRLLALSLTLSFIFTSLEPPAYAHDGTFVAGMTTGPSQGDTTPPGDPPPPGTVAGEGDSSGATDPVLLHTGDFRFEKQDLYIPSRGMALEIKRVYRSRSRYNAMFGYGWDMGFNVRLRKRSNGDIVILTGENRRNEFKKSGASYTSPPGVYDTLIQKEDGSFTLTKKHGDTYQFDRDGKLVSISDRNLNTLSFTYDPQGKLAVTGTSPYLVGQTTGVIVLDWRLTQVTDTVGRAIDLTYNSDGRLIKIKDFTGRVLTYQYDSQGNLTCFGCLPPEGLGAGETLAGYKETYTYDTNHNLATVTDAKAKTYLQNSYDPETDRVKDQIYGDLLESGGTTTLTYDILSNQTTVLDRRGFKTIWTFDTDSNPIRKEVFTSPIRSGDPASYLTLYEYNSNLEQTKITYPNGNVTENTYDSRGNLLSITRKGQGQNPDLDPTPYFLDQNQAVIVEELASLKTTGGRLSNAPCGRRWLYHSR